MCKMFLPLSFTFITYYLYHGYRIASTTHCPLESHYSLKMSETSSRSRSRSPERDGNNAPADNKQNNAVGGAEEQVKLYVGNLSFGKIFRIEETETETENRIQYRLSISIPFQSLTFLMHSSITATD